jgi:hypothetical protein
MQWQFFMKKSKGPESWYIEIPTILSRIESAGTWSHRSGRTQGSDTATGVRGTDGIGDHRTVIGSEGCGVELPKRILKEPGEQGLILSLVLKSSDSWNVYLVVA